MLLWISQSRNKIRHRKTTNKNTCSKKEDTEVEVEAEGVKQKLEILAQRIEQNRKQAKNTQRVRKSRNY